MKNTEPKILSVIPAQPNWDIMELDNDGNVYTSAIIAWAVTEEGILYPIANGTFYPEPYSNDWIREPSEQIKNCFRSFENTIEWKKHMIEESKKKS